MNFDLFFDGFAQTGNQPGLDQFCVIRLFVTDKSFQPFIQEAKFMLQKIPGRCIDGHGFSSQENGRNDAAPLRTEN